MYGGRLRPHIPEKKMRLRHRDRIKQSVLMKNTPLEAGIFAALSPLPMFWVSVFVTTIVGGIGFALLGASIAVKMFDYIPLVVFLLSPTLGVLGIIHSLMKIREKKALLGLLLSILCIVENALMFWGMYYLGRID